MTQSLDMCLFGLMGIFTEVLTIKTGSLPALPRVELSGSASG